ncbi:MULTISPECIES: ABC transporter permease [unclassified Rhizobium]|uniref:ABC transporter permease n=1 Tax=unclassified Rhizobium TaxID=2613769 RepID=UPI001ADB581D|nr:MULTISPECIES: ABC transporter permease [unclassified Rhizobium]MBO9127830.1 ABC transporter permease [Rhizobium sp. 16-488-2b]MBO9176946.1 ABC transporter permease [Rhizobium sp. 16-488-2a]
MNPHNAHRASPTVLIGSVWKNRHLIAKMIRHDVVGRYRGSVLGLGWSFVTPLLMLAVYTFVFSFVFKARWGSADTSSKSDFSIILFVGLIIHGVFVEVLSRAPNLIVANANYVKKVIFPLEILPITALGAAVFHGAVSIAVLICAFFFLTGFLHWTIIFAPIIILPFLLMTLGAAWFLASLGVFVRDIGQVIGLLLTVLLFLSPVFYPMSALPERLQLLMMANPLTFVIEQCRAVIVFGQQPNWMELVAYSSISVFVAATGFWWFQKTRKGFADVL